MSQMRGQEGMPEKGQQGGQASMQGGKGMAGQLSMYLKGVSFPADKQKLLQAARQNGAPQNIISMIEGLSGREYNSPTEVEQAFGQSGGSQGGTRS